MTADGEREARGGCLCGAVRYAVRGSLQPPVACHCGQCRRTSGHFVAATAAADADIAVAGDGALRWYESSPGVRRGFCATCGSNLFWQRLGSGRTSIHAGTLDGPTGLRLAGHIFTGFKGDYYAIDDGLPRLAEGSSAVLLGE